MSRLPPLTGKQVIAALKKAGFVTERQRGSHAFLRHPDYRATVVPAHKRGNGLLSKILRDAELSKDDPLKLLKK